MPDEQRTRTCICQQQWQAQPRAVEHPVGAGAQQAVLHVHDGPSAGSPAAAQCWRPRLQPAMRDAEQPQQIPVHGLHKVLCQRVAVRHHQAWEHSSARTGGAPARERSSSVAARRHWRD